MCIIIYNSLDFLFNVDKYFIHIHNVTIIYLKKLLMVLHYLAIIIAIFNMHINNLVFCPFIIKTMRNH
jgi:hypothetical protein